MRHLQRQKPRPPRIAAGTAEPTQTRPRALPAAPQMSTPLSADGAALASSTRPPHAVEDSSSAASAKPKPLEEAHRTRLICALTATSGFTRIARRHSNDALPASTCASPAIRPMHARTAIRRTSSAGDLRKLPLLPYARRTTAAPAASAPAPSTGPSPGPRPLRPLPETLRRQAPPLRLPRLQHPPPQLPLPPVHRMQHPSRWLPKRKLHLHAQAAFCCCCAGAYLRRSTSRFLLLRETRIPHLWEKSRPIR